MPEDIDPHPQKDENVKSTDDTGNLNEDRFESDTQKVVRQHLEDKNHVITDEDIANVRIGMVPPEFDAATEARFEGEEAREGTEEKFTGGTENINKDENLDDRQITPWDTIDPEK